MKNYVNSELFRMLHNKKLYLLIGAAAALITAMGVVLAAFGKDPDFPYATTAFALGNEFRSMNYLLVIVSVLAMYLDDNEHRQHTMKHSAAFGISRMTIYIARFLAQVIAGVVIYVLMNLLLVGVSFALLKHSNSGEVTELFRAMAAGIPLFLSALAVTHCFLMNTESAVSAETYAVLFLLLLPVILELLGKQVGLIARLSYWHPYHLAAPFLDEHAMVQLTWNLPGGMRDCFLSGTVLTLVFTAAGLDAFQKRELK